MKQFDRIIETALLTIGLIGSIYAIILIVALFEALR